MTQKQQKTKPEKPDKQIKIDFSGIALVGVWYIVYKMYKLRLDYKAKELEILENNKISYIPKKED